jgi:predicted N-formylglutamate amidohydrolase
MTPLPVSLVFTCEHARNRIPRAYQDVEARAGPVLETHCGYDPGTLELGRLLASRFKAVWLAGRCSRLLVELNRSVGHPALWSEYSRVLSPERKRDVLRRYYTPYRRAVEEQVQRKIERGGRVCHISVHSFTPVWKGQPRLADVGLLYDPRRRLEKAFCVRWQAAIRSGCPSLRVRRNYPYLGRADGLTTHLRGRFRSGEYLGIELEVSQAIPAGPQKAWVKLQRVLVSTLRDTAEALGF